MVVDDRNLYSSTSEEIMTTEQHDKAREAFEMLHNEIMLIPEKKI